MELLYYSLRTNGKITIKFGNSLHKSLKKIIQILIQIYIHTHIKHSLINHEYICVYIGTCLYLSTHLLHMHFKRS